MKHNFQFINFSDYLFSRFGKASCTNYSFSKHSHKTIAMMNWIQNVFFKESEKIFDYLSNRVVFLFFFSRPFHKYFKFLKNCPYDFHKTLHSHSTPKGAPACSKASKSYDWNVRTIAKINPKMAKKVLSRLFSIFSKTVLTIRTKFSTVIFYTIVWSMCAISKNSYNWDWSESEGK